MSRTSLLVASILAAFLILPPPAGRRGVERGARAGAPAPRPPRAGARPPVPEPAGLPLMLAGLAFLALAVRRLATASAMEDEAAEAR